jgi:hypothetical protein
MSSVELRQKVADWVKTQGYPLEMQTASALLKRGWHLHHSRTYEDPFTLKEREIDILAFDYHAENETTVPIIGNAVIECKWSNRDPWVLFMATTRAFTATGYLQSTPMTISAAAIVHDLSDDIISRLPLFSELKEGYQLIQARLNKTAEEAEATNNAHKALLQVTTAADYFAQEMSHKADPFSTIYVPVIVLDGALFQCSLDEEGDAKLEEIEMGSVLQLKAAGGATCVHVVRRSALDLFFGRLESTFVGIRKAYELLDSNEEVTPPMRSR